MADDVKLVALLIAAAHALRSYEYGNSSPDLAEEMADAIIEYLADGPLKSRIPASLAPPGAAKDLQPAK